ncbi:GntR family transcriptional regulator [Sphingopyxis sp. H115]|uniref:GntR family transcriptional regulator n=1 Tax=Sphingopyxis sp. H115 TaxID=1759073 RepID=UPI0009EA6B46|nr:GntR family transcriptional regulator [Sphingopyxis sp. H115]
MADCKLNCTDPVCPATAPERIYCEIKRLFVDGHWTPGEYLTLGEVTSLLSCSRTVARDALKQLQGAEMVSLVHRRGFQVPRMNESGLRDLFEANRILLIGAIASSPRNLPAIFADGSYQDQISSTFLQLGKRSGNNEIARRISGYNDHLNRFRIYDHQLLKDVKSEIHDIIDAANDPSKRGALRQRIIRYHNRRIAKVAAYIRLMTLDFDQRSAL